MISVIIPTYNGLSRGFLKEAVQSVLDQTERDFELIIVDDGSSDDIRAGLSEELKDNRVRVVRQANQGLSGARKTGIEHARGDLIALLDDDDRFLPRKLEDQAAFIRQHPDTKVGMVFCGVRLIDAEGRVIGARVKSASGDIYRRMVQEGNGVTAPSAVMMKRDVIDAAGNFDPGMRSLEDMDMWLRIARQYHVYAMPECLADYRLHGNTITAKSFGREEEYERKLYDRILRQDASWDRDQIYGRMYGRFAVRHYSLGNYRAARAALSQSAAHGFWPDLWLLWVMTFLPAGFLNAVKSARRAINGMRAR